MSTRKDKNKNPTSTEGDFIKHFLLALGKGGLEVGQILFDSFRRESMHYKYLRLSGYNPHKIYEGVYNLKRRGILKSQGNGKYKFTAHGVAWYQKSLYKYNLYNVLPWDGKWRVVIFDIPTELNMSRHSFRAKLKFFGFYMLQKSVFVFPYPCEDELVELGNHLKIADYFCLISANSLGSFEDTVKKHFGL